MAAHPAKKARILAGCFGAAGIAACGYGIYQDAVIETDLSLTFRQLSEEQIIAEPFSLSGSAEEPETTEEQEREVELSETTTPETTVAVKEEPVQEKPKRTTTTIADSDSDAS